MSELNGRTPADVLALAERVLGFAEKESPTEVEVMAMADDGSLTRFANSEIHQNVAESNAQVNLRFVTGKRVGVASTNRSDDEGLRLLAERAAAIARNSEELEDWGGLPDPTPIRPVPEMSGNAYKAPDGRRQRMPGMALSPSTTRSRRARNSTTIASTSSCGPVSAATAPTCANVAAPLIVLMMSWPYVRASAGGTTA